MPQKNHKIIGIIVVGFLIFTSPFFTVFAESSESWITTFGGPGDDEAYSVQFGKDGYIIVGMTNSSGSGRYDALLIKTDSSGFVEWNQTYGGPFHDRAHSVATTSDGGYVFAGSKSFSDADNYITSSDYWLVKVDSLGNLEWNQTYDNNEYDSCRSVIATNDGGYALLGYSASIDSANPPFGFSGSDIWLVKVDSIGNVEWNQTYGGDGMDSVSVIIETIDGGYALGCSTASFGAGSTDYWLIKVNSFGIVEWNQTYGGSDFEFANALVSTNDGGYAISGSSGSFSEGSVDVWLVKVDPLGNIEWNQTYGGDIADYCDSMVNSKDSGFTLACVTQTPRYGDGVFWLIQVDSSGNILENQTYGLSAHHSHTSLLITENNNFILAGSTRDSSGFRDFWLAKISGSDISFDVLVIILILVMIVMGIIFVIIYRRIRNSKRNS